MSVYTSVSRAQLARFLTRYDIGQLVDYRGIVAGITNTNYMLDTDTGAFVLTLFEHHERDELDYILGLQFHLAQQHVACAAPVMDRKGGYYSTLNARPAAIVHRLSGEVVESPSLQHCTQVGAELARFHLAGASYAGRRSNPRGLDWWRSMAQKLAQFLSQVERRMLEQEIATYAEFNVSRLPRGALHADLFHDNVMFDGDQLSGFFDFDYACNDALVYDLAITLNDWCSIPDGNLDRLRLQALLAAYAQNRTLELVEIEALPMMLRVAAMRFWLSRLHDQSFPIAGELTFFKPPAHFRDMLKQRRSDATAQLFTDTKARKNLSE